MNNEPLSKTQNMKFMHNIKLIYESLEFKISGIKQQWRWGPIFCNKVVISQKG